ncbi:hypothetical protein HHK36_027242 [Tetracentron sinense]|uniref:Uncharacterized protein n=1 Tax=Tetracentron sinense TaxID=13715 RepID=A0A834YMB0_TETSI|nr:hypothetical protein HHK36_027242 [Tetracentron sinense]
MTILNGSLVPSLTTTWFLLKVCPTLSTNSKVSSYLHHFFLSEEEAFQSPSSMTLRFLVSVLPGFLLKVSPTLSTNSEGIWAILNILGTLGSELGELQHLQYFRLINNKLTESIPKEFTTLSNLKVFDVSNNDLCGTIPIDPRNNK